MLLADLLVVVHRLHTEVDGERGLVLVVKVAHKRVVDSALQIRIADSPGKR